MIQVKLPSFIFLMTVVGKIAMQAAYQHAPIIRIRQFHYFLQVSLAMINCVSMPYLLDHLSITLLHMLRKTY